MGPTGSGATRRSVLKAAAAFAVTSTVACAASTDDEQADLESVGDLRREFDRSADLERFDDLSSSADSQDHYFLAYGVDALTMMFEATGDEAYLDRAVTMMERVVDLARPARSLSSSRYDDSYLTWVSREGDLDGSEVPLHQSYLWRYVTRGLRVLRESPLHGSAEWRSRYDSLLAFTERHIFDKWYGRDPMSAVYRSRTHMASHWAFIGMNLAMLTADPRRAATCREVKDAIDNRLPNYPSSLRGQLGPNPTDEAAYGWSDVWGDRPDDSSSDVSHGNNVVAYAVEAHALDQGWSDDDMTRFARTLDRVIWPAGRTTLADYVDGSGKGSGWLSDGFAKLGRHDRALQDRLMSHQVRDPQFLASMALSASILARS